MAAVPWMAAGGRPPARGRAWSADDAYHAQRRDDHVQLTTYAHYQRLAFGRAAFRPGVPVRTERLRATYLFGVAASSP